VVWLNGSTSVPSNIVTLRRAQLVLGGVTIRRLESRLYHLGILSPTQANSFLRGQEK